MPVRRIKLLMVDDEKDICNFVKILFKKKNYMVEAALTGAKALAVAKKKKPDIALIDIHLAGAINGLEVLRRLQERVPQTACVMVTWDKDAAKVKEAKRLGAVGYLTKPLTATELLKAVDALSKRMRKRGC